MEPKLRLGVITASIREGRVGERVARWFLEIAGRRPELEVVPVDLKEWPLPLFGYPQSPKMIEGKYPMEVEQRWVALVASFDAVVLVTPEYNHGYPPALKNALDYAYAGWNRKPIAFVSYGGPSGGTRAVQQLRQVAVELQMVPVRDEVNIPFVLRVFDAQGRIEDAFQIKRAETLLDAVTWWATALRRAREQIPYPAPR